MNKQIIQQAFWKTVPVFAGYIVLGAGFGILMNNAGFGAVWTAAMSTFIYAGSMQFVSVGMLGMGFHPLSACLMTLMVNARHLFYGISMLQRYKNTGAAKPYLIFALTDETYSLLCDGQTPAGEDPGLYRFLVSLFNQCYWVAGSVMGNLIGSVLPFSTAGIEFSMTALFAASFTEQWLTAKDHLPALTGVLCALACLILFGPENFLIPAMLAITLVLTLLRSREEGDR